MVFVSLSVRVCLCPTFSKFCFQKKIFYSCLIWDQQNYQGYDTKIEELDNLTLRHLVHEYRHISGVSLYIRFFMDTLLMCSWQPVFKSTVAVHSLGSEKYCVIAPSKYTYIVLCAICWTKYSCLLSQSQ